MRIVAGGGSRLASHPFSAYFGRVIASVLTQEDELSALELLRPEPLPDGTEPEERLVFSGISWNTYLAFDKKLGDDRPGPRLYYLEGELEIMSTSDGHERIKKWLGDLLAIYFEEIGVEIIPRGQATMRAELKAAGAEPDESWCIGGEKKYPDLVLEIALTSGGINKLKTYRRFKVPEVWFWRGGHLEVFRAGHIWQLRTVPIQPIAARAGPGVTGAVCGHSRLATSSPDLPSGRFPG